MSEGGIGRTVLIRPGTLVSGIPSETLGAVYGQRTPDARVEFVALVFEYWLKGGAQRRLLRDKFLEVARPNINEGNVYDLISLLAKRGVIDDLFELIASPIDWNGELRTFLLSSGVLIDTIRYYSSFDGISPKAFIDGFLFGVGESFAVVVVDLARLVKLLVSVQQEYLRTLMLTATDVEAGMRSLQAQIAILTQVFDSLVAALDPTEMPAQVVKTWKGWNEEFSRHLENLDAFSAGRTLGKIGGDLWHLLTGFVALAKLLRASVRRVLRYAPLVTGSIRGASIQARVVLRQLASVFATIGKVTIDGIPRVGLTFLRTLFPPEMLRQVMKQGHAVAAHLDLSLIPITQPCYAQAFGGGRLGSPLGVLVSHQGKPLFMATVTETLPSGGTLTSALPDVRSIDEVLDDVFREYLKPFDPGIPQSALAAEAKAASIAMLVKRLDLHLRKLVQRVAYEVFAELRKQKVKIYPNRLGTMIHSRVKARALALISELSPGMKALTEQEMRTIVRSLRASDPRFKGALAQADAVLDQTVAQMILRRKDAAFIMDVIGVEKTAAARTQEELTSFLSKRFGWKQHTTVGDLQPDLIVADADTGRIVNVDWTSSTKADQFEETWGRVVDDLGDRFDGDWTKIADAYRKASKEIPSDVASRLERLTRHAIRETVIRQCALEALFGDLWNVGSFEMTYDGLAKLFKGAGSAAP